MISQTSPSSRPPIVSDAMLQSLDRMFTDLRPNAKLRFLETMHKESPTLTHAWDTYIAARHKDWSDAHPAVAPLDPPTEQSIRQQLVARYPDAQVNLNLTAPVDCDGIGPSYGDYMTDFETSVHIGGKNLNADEVCYHVCTENGPDRKDALAINFINGRMVPSLFGDVGPKLGEASHLTIQKLGLYSSPIDGGASAGHDMYLIPNLGTEFMKTGLQPTYENLTDFCKAQGVPGF